MPARIQTSIKELDPDEFIDGCRPRRTTVHWPEPVFAHLDRLVEAAKSKTDRQELAAALICAASEDRDRLLEALELFRNGRVKQLGKPRRRG